MNYGNSDSTAFDVLSAENDTVVSSSNLNEFPYHDTNLEQDHFIGASIAGNHVSDTYEGFIYSIKIYNKAILL